MVTGRDYWLYRWIDNNNVCSAEDAESLLTDKVAVSDLRAKASDYPSPPYTQNKQQTTIALGAAIDFSGRLDCTVAACRKKQVDRLFRRVWHYFDRVMSLGEIAKTNATGRHRYC